MPLNNSGSFVSLTPPLTQRQHQKQRCAKLVNELKHSKEFATTKAFCNQSQFTFDILGEEHRSQAIKIISNTFGKNNDSCKMIGVTPNELIPWATILVGHAILTGLSFAIIHDNNKSDMQHHLDHYDDDQYEQHNDHYLSTSKPNKDHDEYININEPIVCGVTIVVDALDYPDFSSLTNLDINKINKIDISSYNFRTKMRSYINSSAIKDVYFDNIMSKCNKYGEIVQCKVACFDKKYFGKGLLSTMACPLVEVVMYCLGYKMYLRYNTNPVTQHVAKKMKYKLNGIYNKELYVNDTNYSNNKRFIAVMKLLNKKIEPKRCTVTAFGIPVGSMKFGHLSIGQIYKNWINAYFDKKNNNNKKDENQNRFLVSKL